MSETDINKLKELLAVTQQHYYDPKPIAVEFSGHRISAELLIELHSL